MYSSVENNTLNVTKNKIDHLVNSKCNSNCCSSNHNVSGIMIKNAIKCLSNGKNDEIYNIYSDNFMHATDLTSEILGILITTMLKHGTASELVNKSIVKPIPKNKNKSLSESINLRVYLRKTRRGGSRTVFPKCKQKELEVLIYSPLGKVQKTLEGGNLFRK